MKSRTRQYLETALWSSTVTLAEEEEYPEGHDLADLVDGDNYDEFFGYGDFSDEAVAQAKSDLDDWFDWLEEQGLTEQVAEWADDDEVAHDFWLTRNGHGVGYWDGDYGGGLGRVLSDGCRAWGPIHVYHDDNGRLYFA